MIGGVLAVGQFILDCNGQRDAANPVCTLSPYSPPPATIEHYSIAPTWAIGVAAVVVVIAIIATAIVIYGRIEQGKTWGDRRLERDKAEYEAKARIAEAHNSCQNCGVVYAPRLEDIKA